MGPVSSFLSFSLCTPAAAAYGKSSKGAIAGRNMAVEKQLELACWALGSDCDNTEVAEELGESNDVIEAEYVCCRRR